MSFDLNAFMGQNHDFARGYTFYAWVTGGVGMTPDHQYLVKSSKLPATAIDAAELNWQGNKYKIGTTQTFTDFTISYVVDTEDALRKSYVEWMTQIHNPETNMHGFVGGESGGYLGVVHLQHLSHVNASTIMEYELRGAWPTSVGELSLDYSSKEMATFDVTFAYQFHVAK